MRTSVRFIAALGAAAVTSLVARPAPLAAQSTAPHPFTPIAQITPYAGYLIAGNLWSGPLGLSLGSGSGPLYGVQLSVPITTGVALVGNLGYASGDLSAGIPLVGGISLGHETTLLYDGGVQISAPTLSHGGRGLTPFAQAGVGGIRQQIDASILSTHSNDLAWNVGAGADLALSPTLGVRLLAKDYVGKFDVQQATGLPMDKRTTQNWAFSAGLSVAF